MPPASFWVRYAASAAHMYYHKVSRRKGQLFLNYTGPAHLLRFRRQYATPVRVLTAVAASAGPTMADGLTLPYWLR